MGFGRLGSTFWGFEQSPGAVPDIVTCGKPMGNGFALACVLCTAEVAAAFEAHKVEYFNTFGGNPVSCAAGLAVLEALGDATEGGDVGGGGGASGSAGPRGGGLMASARSVGSFLAAGLRRLGESHTLVGDVRGAVREPPSESKGQPGELAFNHAVAAGPITVVRLLFSFLPAGLCVTGIRTRAPPAHCSCASPLPCASQPPPTFLRFCVQGLFLGLDLVSDRDSRAPASAAASVVVTRLKVM